jgi:hypothetical protein
MADGAVAEANGQQPAPIAEGDTRVEAIVQRRVNEKNTRIQQLEAELATLRPKATSYDAVNQQFADAQAKLHQANASVSYLRAAAPHGFQPAVIDHLAAKYTETQAALPEAQRAPFDQWLGAALANPGGLDPVTSAVIEKHLASRSGVAAAPVVQPVTAPAATGAGSQAGQTQPVVLQAPASNNGVKPNPNPQPGMTPQEQQALIRDPVRFEAWKKEHPAEWASMKKQPVRGG